MNEKRIYQQIRNFERAITAYSGKEPLARFLTKYYKENKQMGSSDRRMTSRLCYNLFRIGSFANDKPLQERVVLAEYLCEQDSPFVDLFRPDLAATIRAELSVKIQALNAVSDTFFPLVDALSSGVDQQLFLQNQLLQPHLFIRIKRGKEGRVAEDLTRRGISFQQIAPQTFALPNGSRLQDLAQIREHFEVQDWSSQRTIDFIEADKREDWWDACAGSGGKALMFLDKYPQTNLLVSDTRLSILRNLDERFEQAKVRANYTQKILDLTTDISELMGKRMFDGIIADVPCSGSGTWGRTPEMKIQFSEHRLAEFAALQKRIVTNVLPYLKSGKVLTYITCSVYKAENEDVVEDIARQHGLHVDRMQLLEGYREGADTMFVACLRKS